MKFGAQGHTQTAFCFTHCDWCLNHTASIAPFTGGQVLKMCYLNLDASHSTLVQAQERLVHITQEMRNEI